MTEPQNAILEAALPLPVEVLTGTYAGSVGPLLERWTRPDGERMGDVDLGYARPLALKLTQLGTTIAAAAIASGPREIFG